MTPRPSAERLKELFRLFSPVGGYMPLGFELCSEIDAQAKEIQELKAERDGIHRMLNQFAARTIPGTADTGDAIAQYIGEWKAYAGKLREALEFYTWKTNFGHNTKIHEILELRQMMPGVCWDGEHATEANKPVSIGDLAREALALKSPEEK